MKPSPPSPQLPWPDDEPAPRILIQRMSSMGDIVFATPLLRALRARWPQAVIGWMVRPEYASWLESDTDLNHVHRFSGDGLRGHWSAARATRKALTEVGYQLVIEAQGLLKTRAIMALSAPKAARAVGFASREPGGFLLDQMIPKGGDNTLIGSEYRYLANWLTGVEAGPPSLHVADAARANVSAEAALAVFCPYTTRPQKHWFDDYWIDLAHRLTAQGLRCLVLGGPGEQAQADALVADMPDGSLSLAGRTSIAEASAWIDAAKLVVGVDTGLTHIGVAVQTPTVALFGSTCPYTGGAAGPLTVLYDDLDCAPCKRSPTCGGAFTCLRQLTPERVTAAGVALLSSELQP